MDDDTLRHEYVENDVGKVWMGSYQKPKSRGWVFGMYDDAVLPTVMLLLEKSLLQHTERGNPVQVARAISAIVSVSTVSTFKIMNFEGKKSKNI